MQLPQPILTPRQRNQVHSAIRKYGLAETDFEFTVNDKKALIQHCAHGFHFTFSTQAPNTTSAANMLVVAFVPYSVQYFPTLAPAVRRQTASHGVNSWDSAVRYLNSWLAWIKQEYGPFEAPKPLSESAVSEAPIPPLAHLHPAVQQVASSRFASAHYSDAIQKACTALEKAVQVKSGQPATATGTSVMTTAFSKNNALIHLADDPNEQFGFMNLYQGAVQALRNHFAHGLIDLTSPARALEWLGFISALFYKLDEAQPSPPTS